MNYPYIEVNQEAYNCANSDCANYPGCANKQGSNYPGFTVTDVAQRAKPVTIHVQGHDFLFVGLHYILKNFKVWQSEKNKNKN